MSTPALPACRRMPARVPQGHPDERAELDAYLEFAYAMALAAGEAILPHFREIIAVEDKRNFMGYDPVTVADRAAEDVIRAAIKRAYPDHGIHGEEHGRETGTSPLTWVIDPIDGTKSFILGQHHWGVLIALHDGTRPVVGVVHQPFVGETFLGRAGGVAQWRRGDARRTLRTRPCARVEDAIVTTTDPRQFRTPAEQAALAAVSAPARFLRYGGDCYCYTQLAMGFVDVVIENGLQPYDVQALMPVIEARGRRRHELDGRPVRPGRPGARVRRSRAPCALLARLASGTCATPGCSAAVASSRCASGSAVVSFTVSSTNDEFTFTTTGNASTCSIRKRE